MSRTTSHNDALALAALHAALRSTHFAETTLPALRATHARLSPGARAAVARIIDMAIRDQRTGVYHYRDVDGAAWRTLQDEILKDARVRELYETTWVRKDSP